MQAEVLNFGIIKLAPKLYKTRYVTEKISVDEPLIHIRIFLFKEKCDAYTQSHTGQFACWAMTNFPLTATGKLKSKIKY